MFVCYRIRFVIEDAMRRAHRRPRGYGLDIRLGFYGRTLTDDDVSVTNALARALDFSVGHISTGARRAQVNLSAS